MLKSKTCQKIHFPMNSGWISCQYSAEILGKIIWFYVINKYPILGFISVSVEAAVDDQIWTKTDLKWELLATKRDAVLGLAVSTMLTEINLFLFGRVWDCENWPLILPFSLLLCQNSLSPVWDAHNFCLLTHLASSPILPFYHNHPQLHKKGFWLSLFQGTVFWDWLI